MVKAPRSLPTRSNSMAENKTKPTDASVEDYILSRASEQQRTDCHELMALLEKVTQHSPNRSMRTRHSDGDDWSWNASRLRSGNRTQARWSTRGLVSQAIFSASLHAEQLQPHAKCWSAGSGLVRFAGCRERVRG